MRIGFVSAILDGWTFEETLDIAHDLGYSAVEVACWPRGKAERRYAGVSHIDVTDTSEQNCLHIREYCAQRGVEITALAYYPNLLDPEKGPEAVEHLKKVIAMSATLDINMVTTFIGRDQHLTIEENIAIVEKVWPPILSLAEDLGVRIAIENCPMLFGPDQWPGGQNIFSSPSNWERVFEVLPSPNLGINYDPSHFVWQMIDYIKPIYQFREKIFHVHIKDIKLFPERLARVGTQAYPLDFMSPKLPGLGDVNWSRYISALTDIYYNGPVCVEIEDRSFEGSREQILNSLRLSKRYMDSFVI